MQLTEFSTAIDGTGAKGRFFEKVDEKVGAKLILCEIRADKAEAVHAIKVRRGDDGQPMKTDAGEVMYRPESQALIDLFPHAWEYFQHVLKHGKPPKKSMAGMVPHPDRDISRDLDMEREQLAKERQEISEMLKTMGDAQKELAAEREALANMRKELEAATDAATEPKKDAKAKA